VASGRAWCFGTQCTSPPASLNEDEAGLHHDFGVWLERPGGAPGAGPGRPAPGDARPGPVAPIPSKVTNRLRGTVPHGYESNIFIGIHQTTSQATTSRLTSTTEDSGVTMAFRSSEMALETLWVRKVALCPFFGFGRVAGAPRTVHRALVSVVANGPRTCRCSITFVSGNRSGIGLAGQVGLQDVINRPPPLTQL
jgi:hypothetical protein